MVLAGRGLRERAVRGQVDDRRIGTRFPQGVDAGASTDPHIGRDEGFNQVKRFHPTFIDPASRNNWNEVELGFDAETAQAEALRCLKCNLAAKIEDMVLPPESWQELSEANVAGVSEESGVYQLLDADKTVLAIKGVENLREGLQGMIGKSDEAKYFIFEIAPFLTQR